MNDLAALCSSEGLQSVRTYIQSGNVVFESALPISEIKSRLERSLARRMGLRTSVMIRTATDMRLILQNNPFPDGQPTHVSVVFLSEPAPTDLLDNVVSPGSEELRLADTEIYVHYPDGMGRSRLKFPASVIGTARNLNTVSKLVAMTGT